MSRGVFIRGAVLPQKGCYKCMFRDGNLCKFLPASVPVVECGKRHVRHKDCPLVEYAPDEWRRIDYDGKTGNAIGTVPEDGQEVNVSANGWVYADYFVQDPDAPGGWFATFGDSVDAWQPLPELPEPY